MFTFSVFDTIDRSTTSVFDNLFSNGAVLFGTAILPTKFFGLPGHHGVEGAYSSGRYTNIDGSPYLDPVAGLVFPGPPKAGSWAVGYLFDQALWVSRDDPKRVWGVFGKFGIADDNPNPIRWTAMAGVSGASPIPGRSRDTFGVGYFYLGISERAEAERPAAHAVAGRAGRGAVLQRPRHAVVPAHAGPADRRAIPASTPTPRSSSGFARRSTSDCRASDAHSRRLQVRINRRSQI